MKQLITAFLFFASTLVLNAQNQESRKLSRFSKISVGNSIELVMEKGSDNTARIETSGVDTDRVLTKVSGSSLSVFMERGNYHAIKVKVHLIYNGNLDAIKTSNSSSLKGKSLIESDELYVKVSNSSKVDLTVDTQELEIDVTNSGKANLEANTEVLDVSVMNSGKLNLSGRTNLQKFNITNSGKFMAYDLKSETVNANISSSGNAEIWVSKELIASASNSGRIYYKGNPEKVIVNSTNSGKVRKAN